MSSNTTNMSSNTTAMPSKTMPGNTTITPSNAANDRTPPSSPGSSRKEPSWKKSPMQKMKSAIQNALELSREAEELGDNSKFGLLRFWKKGTAADKKAHFDREDERAEEYRSNNDIQAKDTGMEKKLHERSLAKLHQQKHQQLHKNREIQEGLHSLGGTKRKVVEMEISDTTDLSLKK
ncbi:hypothetical protein CPB84DRAFT_1750045, partial [Gymnopilus junonius]